MSLTVELIFPPFLEPGVHRPCFALPAEVFHPSPSQKSALAQAKEACADCAVRSACLDSGMARGETGVWGGRRLEQGRAVD